MKIRTVIVMASLAVTALPAAAQERDSVARRAELEQRFRANLTQVVRARLGLTDEQVRRLSEHDRAMQPERRRLMGRERAVRWELRRQVMRGDSADQGAVARLLDEMVTLHRQRAELMAREQRELAAFLTPVQRAKFVALQSELHRRVQSMPGHGRGRVRFRSGPRGAGQPPLAPPPSPEQ